MKVNLFAVLMLTSCAPFLFATTTRGQDLEKTKVTVVLKNETLNTAIADIEKQSDFRFTYKQEEVNAYANITLEKGTRSLKRTLNLLLAQTSLQFNQVGHYIILTERKNTAIEESLAVMVTDHYTMPVLISGRVVDREGQPIPGVNVLEKNTTNGTTTDVDGRYSINTINEQGILVFSFIGYASQEVPISNQTTIDVSMVEDINTLDEVVVVGYGTQKRSDVTGAITSIKPGEAKRAVTTSFDQLLQGRAAGVTVLQNSQAPGGSLTIRVRGTNSINGGNDPLFVIDGIPLDNDNTGRSGNRVTNGESDYLGDGNPQINSLSVLNPNDIESMEILKDASATAIYGSRGANGVILVTTKRGKAGQSTIDVDMSYGIQQVAKRYDMLNASQFMALNNEARANSTPALPTYFDPAAVRFDTDWQDELYRTAASKNFQVAFRGGDEKTRYALSTNYFNQEGVIVGSDLKRYVLRLNLDRNVGKKFKVGANINLSRNESNQVPADANASVVIAALQMSPEQPARYNGIYSNNEDDQFNQDLNLNLNNAGISRIESPLYSTEKVTNRLFTNRVLASVFGELTILKNFTLRSSLNTDLTDNRAEFYQPINGRLRITGGAAQINYSSIVSFLNENTLNYTKNVGDHNFSVVVGQTAQKYNFDRLKVMAEGLNDNTSIYNFSGDTRENNDKWPYADTWTMVSFLGRVNYGFKDKYLATATFRADGSSRFGANNKYGFFPSLALGWVISNENFLQGIASISNLKLRVGYGVTGSQEIGLYNSLSTLGDVRFILNSIYAPGKEPNRIPNPDLSWEQTAQTNIGLDFGLFSERVSGSVNYYNKVTSDLLYAQELPRTSGFANVVKNIGEVNNRGWELELTTDNLTNELKWNTSLNVGFNKNRIEALVGLQNEKYINGDFYLEKGVALGTFYGYETDGLFQAGDNIATSAQPNATPGDRRYKDLTGDNILDGEDRKMLGRILPDYTYGITNSLSYKGFNLSVFFQGVQGNTIFNYTKIVLESLDGRINNHASVLNRWTPTNTNTNIPKAQQAGRHGYGGNANDYNLEDGSYFRLKNITLSYNLPASLLEPLSVRNVRVSVSGDNLWTSTNYTGANPDVSGYDYGAYPMAKSYTLAFNVQF